MADVLLKIKTAVEKAYLWTGVLLIGTMAVLLLIQIFARVVLKSPFFWVEEILRLCQIWLTFIVSPLVLQRSEHPSFRAIPNLLPLAGKKFIWILSMILVVIVGWWLGFYGIRLAANSTFTSANGIPRYWAVIPVIISGFWSMVVAFYKIVLTIRITPEEAKTWKV